MTTLTAPVGGPQLRPLDLMLRSWRIRKVKPYLRRGSAVLDVGCHDGALFRAFADRISRGVGVDPILDHSARIGRFRFVAGTFPSAIDGVETFDAITLLAVLEHVEPLELPSWCDACVRLLAPGGLVVASVASPLVDNLLHVFTRFHLLAVMSVDEHHGFDPSIVPSLFSRPSLELAVRQRFELGMNNLYVFRKGAD